MMLDVNTGKFVSGSEGTIKGSGWDTTYVITGMVGSAYKPPPGPAQTNPADNTGKAVGTIKLERLKPSAKTILNGDSNNWFIFLQNNAGLGGDRGWHWVHPPFNTVVPLQMVFDSGAPSRHSSYRPLECIGGVDGTGNHAVLGGSPGKGRANYLFGDGHAETLSGEVALRALICRNW